MISVSIKGVQETINKLNAVQKGLSNPFDLYSTISRSILSLLRARAPRRTGRFATNIKVLSQSSRQLVIGEDVDNVEYANRVIFGRNSHGGPFSALGYQMFDRYQSEVESMVRSSTEAWVNSRLLK